MTQRTSSLSERSVDRQTRDASADLLPQTDGTTTPSQSTNPKHPTRMRTITDFFQRTIKTSINTIVTNLTKTHTPRNRVPRTTQTNLSNTLPQTTLTTLVSEGTHIAGTIDKSLPTGNNAGWGDPLQTRKTEDSVRLYFQNVNSLRPTSQIKWAETLDNAARFQCDIVGFVETGINTNLHKLTSQFRQTLRQRQPHSNISFSHCQHQIQSSYVPRGTATVVMGNWTGRGDAFLRDPKNMGRWCGITFRLSGNRSLHLLTAYRVCKQNIATAGSTTAFTQQFVKLRQEGHKTPDPRKTFLDDLSKTIQELCSNPNDSCILMIDANSTLQDKDGELQTFITTCGLTDLLTTHHQSDCQIPTYARSKDRRIDFIFGTSNLLPYIRKCGYTPFFNTIAESDHRGIFLDLDAAITDQTADLKIPISRLINTRTPVKEISKYIDYIDNRLTKEHLYERIDELHSQRTVVTDKESFEDKLNNLDSILTAIVLKAEREHCRPRPTTKWSPSIHSSSVLLKYWRTILRSEATGVDAHQKLEDLKQQLTPEDRTLIESNTLHPAQSLRAAKALRKERLQKHHQLRAEYMETMPTTTGKQSNKKQTTTNQSVCLQKTHKILKGCFRPNRNSGLTHVDIPVDETGQQTDPDNAHSWTRVSDPKSVEQLLIARNKKHFGQAQGSPFTTAPFQNHFGYEGCSPAVNSLFHGDVPDAILNHDPGSRMILQQLQKGRKIDDQQQEMSLDQFRSGFRKWNERTSTSPSGRHLGHYKVLVSSQIRLSQEHHDKREKIFSCIYKIAVSAFSAGVTIQRWCQSTTLMIEKLIGQPKLNKLRVIHLYEADFNMCLKLIWSRTDLWNAHRSGSLNDAQSGARPGRQCIDVVVSKELKYNYARLTRTMLATMDNDASACYDRIVCCLAMMISQYFGIPHPACVTHGTTLRQMAFRLRTSMGDSTECYKHTLDSPIHGSGQGSCASPCLWTLISSVLMDCMTEYGIGMQIQDVMLNETMVQWIEGFVDDSSIFSNCPITQQDQNLLIQNIQADANLWNTLLKASGGKLELSKCFVYLLLWDFSKEGIPTEAPTTNIRPIQVFDNDNNNYTDIRYREVNQPHRTLGVWKTLSLSENEHTKKLTEKSVSIAHNTRRGCLTRHQARTAFHSIYIPSMRYSLAATSLSQKDLHKVQKPAMAQLLPAMGYDRHFPRAAVFAPMSVGGLGLHRLYTEANVLKLRTIICHIRAQTYVGTLIKINLNWLQLQSGWIKPILECTEPLEYVNEKWFCELKRFLHSIKGRLRITGIWKPQLERTNDRGLMEAFLSVGLTPKQYTLVNAWRMYFKAITLSDITNAAGTHVSKVYLQRPRGRPFLPHRTSKLRWPIQPEPGPNGFRLWKLCLTQAFHLDKEGKLTTPLGNWIVSASESHSTWDTYLHPSTGHLYHVDDISGAVSYQIPSMTRPRSIRYGTLHHSATAVPDLSIPVDSEPHGTGTVVRRTRTVIICPQESQAPSTFSVWLSLLPEWKKNLLEHSRIFDSRCIRDTVHSLSHVVLVSDGGLNNQQGTFGAIIGTQDGTIIASTMGRLRGKSDLQSSFRSEAVGTLAAFSLWHEILTFYQITHRPQILFFTDNKSLVDRFRASLQGHVSPSAFLRPDCDVELQIVQSVRDLTASLLPSHINHVKGHQDRNIGPLTLPAFYNVQADKLATKAFQLEKWRTSVSIFPAGLVHTFIDKYELTSRLHQTIRTEFNQVEFKKYLMTSQKWSNDTFGNIWWEPQQTATRLLSWKDRIRIQKFVYHRLPTRKIEARIKPCVSSFCPLCRSKVEDNDHLLRCQDTRTSTLRDAWLRRLAYFIHNTLGTSSGTITILKGIRQWIQNDHPLDASDYTSASSELRMAIILQNEIGWGNLLRGRFSTYWSDMVEEELRQTSHTSITSAKWGAQFLHQVWIGIIEIWESRNSIVHGSTSEQQERQKIESLLLEVDWMQRSVRDKSLRDRELIMRPLTELGQMSSRSLSTWVRHARLLLRLDDQDISGLARSQGVMKNWLKSRLDQENTTETNPNRQNRHRRENHTVPIIVVQQDRGSEATPSSIEEVSNRIE